MKRIVAKIACFFPVFLFITSISTEVANAAPFAYIANFNDNNVSVIDTATNAVVGSPIAVGTKPSSLAVDPAGAFVYVVNYGSNTVSVLSTATNTVVSTIAVPGPGGIAVHPAGTSVYVTNYSSSKVSVIDTYDNTVVQTIAVGTDPLGIAVNPAGTLVYVANSSSNTVSVIDTDTNSVVTSIPVQTAPFGVALDSSGARLYVSNRSSGTVSVIDTATNTVVATAGDSGTAGAKPVGVAVHPSGARVYVASYAYDCVSVIDTATNTIVGNPIYVGTSPLSVALNPSGTLLYVTNNGSANVSVIDTASNTVVKTVTVGNAPTSAGLFIGPDAVNGACGSDNTLTLSTEPGNLCTAGAPSSIKAGATSYTWSCNGNGVGATAACSALRLYEVSTSVSGDHGIIDTSRYVPYNATPTFTITPKTGYLPGPVSGTCGGTPSGNNFTTNAVTASCTVAATFIPAATTPISFGFIAQKGIAPNSVATSTTITVSGIAAGAAPIAIAGGTYSINGGAYSALAGTIKNGDTVTLRQTSSATPGVMTTATVNIGGIKGDFWVTTSGAGCQLSPVLNSGTGSYYTSIQNAYDHAGSADVLEILAFSFGEDLLLNGHKKVTLKGGFNCAYATNANQYTTVRTLTVSGTTGQVIAANLIIGGIDDATSKSSSSGILTLPQGIVISPHSLTITSATGDVAVGADGNFRVAEPQGGGLATLSVTDSNGKLVLLGYLDGDHPEKNAANPTTTAVELLFWSTLSFMFPQEEWPRIYDLLTAAPETATLADVIAARMIINPTAVGDRDPAITAALTAATNSLRNPNRNQAKATQRAVSESIIDPKIVSNSASSDKVMVSGLTGNFYGLSVLPSLDDLGIIIQNRCRIHRRYVLFRTGFIPNTGHFSDPPTLLPKWIQEDNGYISATTGVTAVIGGYIDAFSGNRKIAWAPKITPTIPLPISPTDAKASIFRVYVVGPGIGDLLGSIPADLMNQPEAKSAVVHAFDEAGMLTLGKELLWPMFSKILPAAFPIPDSDSMLSLMTNLAGQLTTFGLNLDPYIEKNDLNGAVTELVKLLTSNPQARTIAFQLVSNVLVKMSPNAATAGKCLEKTFANICKALNLADIILLGSDMNLILYDVKNSNMINQWDVKAISGTTTLKPAIAKVSKATPKATFTLRVMGVPGTELPLYYMWYGVNKGVFDDHKNPPNDILLTDQSIVTYNAYAPVPTSGTDTVLVDIFDAHKVVIKTATATVQFRDYVGSDWWGVWVGTFTSTCGGGWGGADLQVGGDPTNPENGLFVLVASTWYAWTISEFMATASGDTAVSTDGSVVMKLSGDGAIQATFTLDNSCEQSGVFTYSHR